MNTGNRNIRWVAVAVLLHASVLIAGPRQTSVVVDFDKGKIKYEVDSKPVRSDKILEVLSEIKKRGGSEGSVAVLVDERNSLAALNNIRGIIDKTGFSKVQYFFFTADRERMAEIEFSHRAVPFSLSPEPATSSHEPKRER